MAHGGEMRRNSPMSSGAPHRYAQRAPDSAYTLDIDLHTTALRDAAAHPSSDCELPTYSIYVSSIQTRVLLGAVSSAARSASLGTCWPVGLFGLTMTTRS